MSFPINGFRRVASMKFGSFNVRGLTSNLKQCHLAKDMARYELDILCLQETKVTKGSTFVRGDSTFILLDSSSPHYGNGFVVSNRLSQNIVKYKRHSDRISSLTVKIGADDRYTLNVVNCYGPHSGRTVNDPQEADDFYATLHQVVSSFSSNDLLFVMGDFNSKLGTKKEGESFMGAHGRGIRNNNGHILASVVESLELFACNTAFQKSARHKTSWVGRRKEKHIYNQIDYIFCPQKFKAACSNAQSWGGTWTISDHKLVQATFDFSRLYGIIGDIRRRKKLRTERFNVSLLQTTSKRLEYSKNVTRRLENCAIESIEEFNNIIKGAAKEVLGLEVRKKYQICQSEVVMNLSKRQRAIHLLLSDKNISSSSAASLKKERNQVMHEIRKECHAAACRKVESLVEEIEAVKDQSTRMFKAVSICLKKPFEKIQVKDDDGNFLGEQQCGIQISSYFKSQFYSSHESLMPIDLPAPLDIPITSKEFQAAFQRLSNNRSPGIDNIPGELFKYGGNDLADVTANMFNKLFELNDTEELKLGEGVLIALQKPGKAKGLCSNLRPIVLLKTLRKSFSLVVLNRIKDRAYEYISPYQSGFRSYRSTMDAVWTHRWNIAKSLHFKRISYIFGIDLSRAFDTIDRVKLLEILCDFLSMDEVRMIALLLKDTTMQLRFNQVLFEVFKTNIGITQGDGLSPLLFNIYLEAAIRDLAKCLKLEEELVKVLIAYADDADFRTDNLFLIDLLEAKAPAILSKWNLQMNLSKSEFTHVEKRSNRTDEYWRNVKKLGSLLGDTEDILRRKNLARAALSRMWKLWVNRNRLSESLRIRLYNAYIKPVLLYNCGTWGVTDTVLKALESFHRSQLRRILGVYYPDHLSNKDVYSRCKCHPLRYDLLKARWKSFGHILRRGIDIPANLEMESYFNCKDRKWPGKKTMCLPLRLHEDLKMIGWKLETIQDLHRFRKLAEDRVGWQRIVDRLLSKLLQKYDSEEDKRLRKKKASSRT